MKCERCQNTETSSFVEAYGKIVCNVCKSVVEECCQGQQITGGAPPDPCARYDDDVPN